MKNKHAAVLSNFLGDMLNISTSKNFPGFFYRSRAHAMIVLIITKSNIKNENMGFEDICTIIPKYVSSRTTIKTILDHGIKYKYFTKSNSTIDKRKKVYAPSREMNIFMLEWILRNNKIFKNI